MVCPFSSGDISREVREEGLMQVGFCDLRHALSLERCSQGMRDSQG